MVEVALKHLAVGKIYLAHDRRRQAVDDTRHHLRFDIAPVEGGAQILDAPDFVDRNATVGLAHFDDLRGRRAEGIGEGNTTPLAVGNRGAPVRHGGGLGQYRGRNLVLAAHQLQPHLDRIEAGRSGQLVDKTFMEKRIV